MAFDPITYNEVLSGKDPVGSLVRVVSNFSDPKYVNAGTTFSAAEYPVLADKVPGGFQGDFYVEKPLTAIQSYWGSSNNKLGTVLVSFLSGGKLNFIFGKTGATSLLYWYRSVSGDMVDGVEYVGPFVLPEGNDATQFPLFSVANDHSILYASVPGRHYQINLSDPTLNTFVKMASPDTTKRYSFASDGTNLVAAAIMTSMAAAGGMFRSTDNGASWVQSGLITGMTSSVATIQYGNGSFIVKSTGSASNSARSRDGGATWTVQTVGTVGYNGVKYNPTLNLFVGYPFNSGAFYTSPDGTTWTARTTSGGGQSRLNVLSNGTMFTSNQSDSLTNGVMNRSTDGITWAARQSTAPFSTTSNNPMRAIGAVEGAGNMLVAFTAASVTSPYYGPYFYSYSTDGGSTWSSARLLPPSETTKKFMAPVISSSKSKVLMMESYGGLNTSTSGFTTSWNGIISSDGGDTWQTTSINSGSDVVSWQGVLPTYDDKFFAWGTVAHDTAGNRAMCSAWSADGLTWQYTSYTTLTTALQQISPSYVSIGADNTIYFGNSSSSTAATSTNYGATWTQRSFSFTGGKTFTFKDKTIHVVSGQLPKYTINGGVSWLNGQMAAVLPSQPVGYACDSNVAVMTLASSTTFYYSYDGVIWITATLPAALPGTGTAIVNGWVIIPTGAGAVYRTKDFKSWEYSNVGDDIKYSSMAFTTVASDLGGETAFMHGPDACNTAGYILKADTTVGDRRRIPAIPSDLPNTKWVVIGR